MQRVEKVKFLRRLRRNKFRLSAVKRHVSAVAQVRIAPGVCMHLIRTQRLHAERISRRAGRYFWSSSFRTGALSGNQPSVPGQACDSRPSPDEFLDWRLPRCFRGSLSAASIWCRCLGVHPPRKRRCPASDPKPWQHAPDRCSERRRIGHCWPVFRVGAAAPTDGARSRCLEANGRTAQGEARTIGPRQ